MGSRENRSRDHPVCRSVCLARCHPDASVEEGNTVVRPLTVRPAFSSGVAVKWRCMPPRTICRFHEWRCEAEHTQASRAVRRFRFRCSHGADFRNVLILKLAICQHEKQRQSYCGAFAFVLVVLRMHIVISRQAKQTDLSQPVTDAKAIKYDMKI